MSEVDRINEANVAFAVGFDKGGLEIPPARPLAVLTCIDSRLILRGSSGSRSGTRTSFGTRAGGQPTTRFARS
jgi:hypothetical protein